MSVVLHNAGRNSFLPAIDRLLDPPLASKAYSFCPAPDRPFEDGRLWSRTRGLGLQFPDNLAMDAGTTGRFEEFPMNLGGQSMLQFVGITRDSANSPLGACVVSLFLATGKVWLRDVTSDANGNYTTYSQFAAQNHFMVAYKPGSPDVAGTSANTLQPV